MKNQITEGQWFVSGNSEVVSIPSQCKIAKVSGYNYEETKANALLISKAPELLDKLNKARIIIAQMKRSMLTHPDCTEGSEFDDFTSSAQEIEDEIEKLINVWQK